MPTNDIYYGDEDESDNNDDNRVIIKNINDSGTESSEDPTLSNTLLKKSSNNKKMSEVQITLAKLENELAKSNNKDNVQGLIDQLKSYLKDSEQVHVEQNKPIPPPRKCQQNRNKNRHSIAVPQSDNMTVQDFLDRCNENKDLEKTNERLGNNLDSPNTIGNVRHISNENVNTSDLFSTQTSVESNINNHSMITKEPLVRQSSLGLSKDFEDGKFNRNSKPFTKQFSIDSSNYHRPELEKNISVENISPNIKKYNDINYTPPVYTPEVTDIDRPLIAKLTLRENNKNDDADDGDISSDDDDGNLRNARKLLKFAKNEMKSKQLVRSNKKIKMKRSNTIAIDIPKNMKYYSSGDELNQDDRTKTKTPSFIPKTENDFKFLAFLQKNNSEDTKSYNSAARGGAHWSNRFSSIKTTFENAEKQSVPITEPRKSQAKLFWQKSEEKMVNKPPWSGSEEQVVTGSLVVQTKPKQNFTHAIKSPFQAVNKVQSLPQTKTSYTGTVKQMANEKFNKLDNVHNSGTDFKVDAVNAKVNQFETNIRDREYHKKLPEQQNAFSSSVQRNFIPENFKPIGQSVPQNSKPIIQPVHPYQKPQVLSNFGAQSQYVRKQFPEPQYQKSAPKVLSPQYNFHSYKDPGVFEPPYDFQDRSPHVNHYPDVPSNFTVPHNTPKNFQISETHPTEFYDNELSQYAPHVLEIHKSPLCTKNGSHFTPISPAVTEAQISYEPQTVAVSRVMGKEQCQQAVIVNKNNKQHLNDSTNILKNIISQHQSYDSPVDEFTNGHERHELRGHTIPSQAPFVHSSSTVRPNVIVAPINYSSSSSHTQSYSNYPPSSNHSSNSYNNQHFISPRPPSSTFSPSPSGSISYPYHQSYASPRYTYTPTSVQSSFSGDTNRFTPQNSNQTRMDYNYPANNNKTRPNSMYNHTEHHHHNSAFTSNPIYSSNNAPYALTGSKSSSSIYPSTIISPINHPYRNGNTSQDRNYSSIPSNQFADSQSRNVSNNVRMYERANSQPPPKNAQHIVPKVNSKYSSGDKISYMNYISQISPQTLQNKIHYNPERKSVSPSYNINNNYGELSQSSTQSSISENSPMSKLNSPLTNLSTPSSPQLPAPPILTKTPQLKISAKTAFVPVKPFSQSIPTRQNLGLPPTSPLTNVSPGLASPPPSPIMPSVLQKSESWHQMVLDKMAPKKTSPIPGISKLAPKAKSSHSLNFAKQFEAAIPDTIEKQKTVEAFLKADTKKEINKYNFKQFKKTKSSKNTSNTGVVSLGDNLENVDEAFDSLFNSSK